MAKSWKDYYDKEKAREYAAKWRAKKRQENAKPVRVAKKTTTNEAGLKRYDGEAVYIPAAGEKPPEATEITKTIIHSNGMKSFLMKDGRWWGPAFVEE